MPLVTKTYEQSNKAWHENVRDMIEVRNKACLRRYQGNREYVPDDDPYQWRDYKKFISEMPFKLEKDCKMKKPITRKLDKTKRIFVQAKNSSQCRQLDGSWDVDAYSRENGYDKGVCWARPRDRSCAKHVPADLLRKHPLSMKEKVIALRETASKNCVKDENCSIFKNKHQQDCVSKETAEMFLETIVEHPPDNMPKDVSRNGVEGFLYDWYVKKSPSNPPKTTELIGKGNRCTSNATDPAEKMRLALFQGIDPHSLNPIKVHEFFQLKKMFGRHKQTDLEEYRRLFSMKKLDEAKTLLTDLIADKEAEYEEENVTQGMGYLPSIPQSVVNMVMKHIARQESTTNRGMMAWHSTGSGKTCTATGVMDAFWDTDRQIIFASSKDAIDSNPDYKFHECASRLFPRFQKAPFIGKDEDETKKVLASHFENRGLIFVSFAMLANRIKKSEKFKKLLFQSLKRPVDNSISLPQERHRTSKTNSTSKSKSKSKSKNKSRRKSGGNVTNIKPPAPLVERSISNRTSSSITSDTPKQILVKRISKWYDVKDLKLITRLMSECNIHSVSDFVDLDHAVLIIDEVHNLFRPRANQKKEHEIVEKELINPLLHPNLKIVILTATPGDNIPDVMKLLNIIRDVDKPMIVPPAVDDQSDVNRFLNDIRGLVSFFDMSGDDTKFPVVIDHGPVKFPMSMKQFEKYIEAFKAVKDDQKNYEKLAKANQLNKYYSGARKYANMLFTFEKSLQLSEFSSKLPALLENIKQYSNEKQYVYSAFYENRGSSQGILAVARELEKMGYKKLTLEEAKAHNLFVEGKSDGILKRGKTISAKELVPAKRYILAIQNEIGEDGSTEAGKNLGELIKVYNNGANKNGEYVGVFLASQGFNEGIDLKAVRHIHIFEPLVTMASDLQTIGRARRYCSHADLDRGKGEWTVKIHRYMSDFPIAYSAKSSQNELDKQITNSKKDVEEVENKQKEADHAISSLDTKLEEATKALKDMGTKGDKEQKEKLKMYIKEIKAKQSEYKAYKKELAKLVKTKTTHINKTSAALKKESKLKTDDIKNIDEFIYVEARNRMKDLFVIHQLIKQAAIDCRILKDFHSKINPNDPLTCARFESSDPKK